MVACRRDVGRASALFAKYSAILTMAGALIYLVYDPGTSALAHTPCAWLAALIALLVFSPS